MPRRHSLKVTCFRARYMKPVAIPIVWRGANKPSIYIPMKQLLIQGANPYDERVHGEYDNFQGGYRCELIINTQPARGSVVIGWDTLGFEYTPTTGVFSGHDTFSYKLRSALGQESDSQCVHLFIGV